MQDNKVVAIVGMAGAGKSTTREVFEKNGYQNVYFGGIVLDEVKSRGLELTQEHEKPVREELRAKEGMDVMAKQSIPKINEILKTNKNVVIDDLYSQEEANAMSSTYGGSFVLVAVKAPEKSRHDRLKDRPERPLTLEEAKARDKAELDNLNKSGPIENANHILINDSTIESIQAKTQRLIDYLFT